MKSNYAGTRLYKQEIEGVFNDDVAGALFTLDMISEARIDRAEVPDLARVVVAVDPAQTSSEGADESGIIVAGDDGSGHAYVLADYSLRGIPEQVMRRAVDAFHAHKADCVVFEDQSGGDWLVAALRHVDPNVPYKKVHAMRGKYLRAQPVACSWSRAGFTTRARPRISSGSRTSCAPSPRIATGRKHTTTAPTLTVMPLRSCAACPAAAYMSAYSMVKCEDCKKVYRDDQLKCPKCGLEREVFDPPDRKKGPGAQFRDGEGLAGWREVYSPESPDAVFDRQYRLLQQVIGMQPGIWPGSARTGRGSGNAGGTINDRQ